MSQDAQHALPFDPADLPADDDTKLDDGSFDWEEAAKATQKASEEVLQESELLPVLLSLNLEVRDPDVIAMLAPVAEGRDRNQQALDALRIGVLALQNATSRVDADRVKDAGGQLITQLQQALEQHSMHAKQQTEQTLKDYFDPDSGRLAERVQRLVSDDGELSQLMKDQLHGDGSPLSKLLADQFWSRKLIDAPARSSAIHRFAFTFTEDGR